MRRDVIVAALLVAALGGCAPAQIHRTGEASSPAAAGEAIVFVDQDSLDDGQFPVCVAERVQSARPDLRVLPPRQFRDVLFPWFEWSTRPSDADGLADLLARPDIKQRMADVGPRYIALIGGRTTMGEFKGGILCGGGYGGGGCLGLTWAKRETNIVAVVWDMRVLKPSTFDVAVRGVWIIPALIIPIPLLGATETSACSAVAEQIVDHLSGATPTQGRQ